MITVDNNNDIQIVDEQGIKTRWDISLYPYFERVGNTVVGDDSVSQAIKSIKFMATSGLITIDTVDALHNIIRHTAQALRGV